MGPDRWGNGGFVKILNAEGKELVRMGADSEGDGFVKTRNANGVWDSL